MVSPVAAKTFLCRPRRILFTPSYVEGLSESMGLLGNRVTCMHEHFTH
jgi:hypothetical protein